MLSYGAAIAYGPVQPSVVARLAEFFPGSVPVRLPVTVRRIETEWSSPQAPQEDVIVEYATGREVLFRTENSFDFGESLLIQNSDGSLQSEVFVVAVQWLQNQSAVAARFVEPVANWIVK